MDELSYLRPVTIEQACAALGEPGTRALAGGTDVIVQLREGRRQARRLVDLKAIDTLSDVSEMSDGGLSIGAAVTAAKLARDARLVECYPALAGALSMIGSRQIQNRATLGGNICNGAPSADAVPALMCYGARARIAALTGNRTLPVEEVFRGPGETHLATGELLTHIELPPPAPRSVAHYMRFTPRREMDIAVVGVGAWVALGEDGCVREARIALASVAPTPIRSPAGEAALIGSSLKPETFAAAAAAARADTRAISDTRGSAEFRCDLVETLTRRVLVACHQEM